MGRLSLAVVVMVAVGACHGQDPSDPLDGPPPDRFRLCDGGLALFCTPPPDACNPLAPPGMQGCDPGLRCVWEIVQEEPDRLGRIACVPDGTAALGEACAPSTVGAPDECLAGLVCVGGVCADVCGFDGSAGAACAPGYNCTRYDGLFANGSDDPIAGACNPGCDPVNQVRLDNGEPCGAGLGCYLLTSQTDTIAVCANDGEVGHGEAISGTAFANSCVPGAQPRRRDGTSMTIECGGLCAPADVTATTNMASEAGVAPLGCERWGAAPPSDGTAGESCRYWWAREPFETISPYSNSVGWCFKHAVFQYDTNGDMTPDAPFPRCTTLTTGDVEPPIGDPPHNDAQFFWCVALPATFSGGPPGRSLPAPPMRTDRLRM